MSIEWLSACCVLRVQRTFGPVEHTAASGSGSAAQPGGCEQLAQVLVERLLLPAPQCLHLYTGKDCTRRALKCVCREGRAKGRKEAGKEGVGRSGEKGLALGSSVRITKCT